MLNIKLTIYNYVQLFILCNIQHVRAGSAIALNWFHPCCSHDNAKGLQEAKKQTEIVRQNYWNSFILLPTIVKFYCKKRMQSPFLMLENTILNEISRQQLSVWLIVQGDVVKNTEVDSTWEWS